MGRRTNWKRIQTEARKPENHTKNLYACEYRNAVDARKAAKRVRERYGVNTEVQGAVVWVRGMLPDWIEPEAEEVDAPRKERRWGYNDLAATCKRRQGDKIKVGLYSSRASARKIGNNMKWKYGLTSELRDVGKACELWVSYPWPKGIPVGMLMDVLPEDEHRDYIKRVGEDEEFAELYIRADLGKMDPATRKTFLDDWDNSPAEAKAQPGVWVYVDMFINAPTANRLGRKMRIDHGLQYRVGAGRLLFIRDNTNETEELKAFLPKS
ncbi:MAG: hypothetical protein GY906_37175 [bacterium]|nr:hypothetical protein [bacterium]